ncbi:MAG: DUF3048 domain-containing protein [Bacillota bacterium]
MRKFLFLFLVFLLLSSTGCSNKEPEKESTEKVITNSEKVEESIPETSPPISTKEPLVKENKELPGAFIVSIDNHRNAYPHSGLNQADRVYEILAEGGITRYLAVFHSNQAEKIGPIRSARYYFAYIAKGHDLPFAHAGGSAEALDLIAKLKLKDFDEIYNSGAYFQRDKSRKPPHNLYTSTELMVTGANKKGYELLSLKPLPLGKDMPGGEPISLVDITYSTDPKYLYTVTYEWDGARFKRYINGIPHKVLTGEEIYTENVIVMAAKTREYMDGKILKSNIEIIGGDKAFFFTNGQVYRGSWKKSNAESEFEFYVDGKPMKFFGQHAWINVVPSLDAVTFKKID